MRRALLLATLATLAAVCLALPASAHNPALTTYAPVELDGGALAVGEEGTVALVDEDGQTLWNDTLEAHVTQDPVASNGAAAFPARQAQDDALVLFGYDADGTAWQASLPGEGFAWVAPAPEGFLVVTTAGDRALVSTTGDVLDTTHLDVGAREAAAPLPDGGHVLPTTNRSVALIGPDGTVQHEAPVPGVPTTVLATDQTLYAGALSPEGNTTVIAFTHEMQQAWTYELDALRVGGDLALSEHGPVFGTFHPDGAQVVSLDHDGQERWNRTFEDQTAAAASTHQDAVFAVTNEKALALDAEDGQTLWEQDVSPRLVSPSLVGDTLVPSGADNEIVALDTNTGDPAWTWSDEVTSVAWYGHGSANIGGSDDPGEDASPVPLSTAVIAVSLLAAAAARTPRS